MASSEFITKRIEGKQKEISKLEKRLERIMKAKASNWEDNPYCYSDVIYRYYTLYRPPMPGTVPRRDLEGVKCFDDRTEVEPGVMAWGYADYNRPLTAEETADYELALASSNQAI